MDANFKSLVTFLGENPGRMDNEKFFTLIDQFQTTFCRTIETVRKEKERKERVLKKEAEKKLRDAARSARAINRSRASGTRRGPSN
mmetsp:Transcript_5419/g.12307  ORF Transcript_5419/g.12307 Transcript_5419/m.12307 type:complete len:86 (+) Transcript_5419:1389-1646(+)